jgi:hypothetical protein
MSLRTSERVGISIVVILFTLLLQVAVGTAAMFILGQGDSTTGVPIGGFSWLWLPAFLIPEIVIALSLAYSWNARRRGRDFWNTWKIALWLIVGSAFIYFPICPITDLQALRAFPFLR